MRLVLDFTPAVIHLKAQHLREDLVVAANLGTAFAPCHPSLQANLVGSKRFSLVVCDALGPLAGSVFPAQPQTSARNAGGASIIAKLRGQLIVDLISGIIPRSMRGMLETGETHMAQDWWMFHANEEHTGNAAGASSIDSNTVSRMALLKQVPVDFNIISIPAIVAGKVFVGTTPWPNGGVQGGSLYRFDLATGVLERRFAVRVGSRLIAYQTSFNNQQHVIFIGSDNHVHELFFDNKWHHNDLTQQAGAPPATPISTLDGYQTTFNNQQHVNFIGGDNHVHELFFDNKWHHNDLTQLSGAPTAALGSAVDGYATSFNNQQHVNFIGSDNHVHELFFDNKWHHNDLTLLAGAPAAVPGSALDGYQTSFNNQQHVNFIGSDNHVHELFFDNKWHHNDLTQVAAAPTATPGSALDGYQTSFNNQQHVNFIGNDNHVHELFFDNKWHHNDLTLLAGAPVASIGSAIDGYQTSFNNQQHVNFIGNDSHVHELFFDNKWHHNDLTLLAGAPTAPASPLDGYETSFNNQQHVNFIGNDNHVHELFFDNKWHHNDLTQLAGAPPVAAGEVWGFGIGSSPAVVMNPADRNGRVFFLSLEARVFCLDVNTFALLWTTDLRNPDPSHNQPVDNSNPPVSGWTSPLVVKGNVYVGVGLGEDGPPPGAAYGFIYCLDAATGNVKWLFCTNKFSDVANNSPNDIPHSLLNYLPPNTPPPQPFRRHANDPLSRGASVWSPPAYDSVSNCILFGTGNPSPDGPLPNAPYSSGLLALEADTGAYHGFFQPTATDSYRPTDDDVDVPSGPTVFSRGQQRIVGAGSKNGFYFLLDPKTMNLLGGRQLLPYKNDDRTQPLPGVDPGAAMGPGEDHSGVYGSAAVHFGLGYLFVGLGGWGGAIDSSTTPFLRALKWDNTLADAWKTQVGNDGVRRYTGSPGPKPPLYTTSHELVAGSPGVVNDIVFVPTNKPALYALDVATGSLKWTASGLPAGLPGTTENYVLGPAISGEFVVVGCEANLFIYSLRG